VLTENNNLEVFRETKMIRLIILIVAILIGVSNTGLCEIYKWRNDDGTIGFTDDISKVSEKYRNQINIKADKKPIKKKLLQKRTFLKFLNGDVSNFNKVVSRLKIYFLTVLISMPEMIKEQLFFILPHYMVTWKLLIS